MGDEDMSLHMRTAAEVAYWPLEVWSDQGQAHVECRECGSGQLLRAGFRGNPFVLADLVAKLEEHIPQCRGTGRSRPS